MDHRRSTRHIGGQAGAVRIRCRPPPGEPRADFEGPLASLEGPGDVELVRSDEAPVRAPVQGKAGRAITNTECTNPAYTVSRSGGTPSLRATLCDTTFSGRTSTTIRYLPSFSNA